jgi:hypothetical protein
MVVNQVKSRDKITLLDLRTSILVSKPQDFDAIRRQVRKIQARKVTEGEDRKHFSRLFGITVRVPGEEEG